MSEPARDKDGGRSKSTSSNVLNSILNGRNNRENSKLSGQDSKAKRRSQNESSKLNRSTDKSKLHNNADSSIISNKGSTTGKANGTAGGTVLPKGVAGLKHVKDILNAYKSNMQEKKINDSTSGVSPIGRISGKSRQGQSGTSTSISKLNTSLDRSRNGQRSVDLKKKLVSAAGLQSSTSGMLKKSAGGAKKDTLNTSSSVASDLLNRTAGNGLKVGRTGTSKSKTGTAVKVGSKMIPSKSASKMSLGLGSKFGRTLDSKTEDDTRKEGSHIGTESTKDYSKKHHQDPASNVKANQRTGSNDSSSNSRPKRSENNTSKQYDSTESPMNRNTEDNDDLEEAADLNLNGEDAQDFKKKPSSKGAHRLASLVTQVKPGHMFNETSKKQIDLDKEIKKIHTPRGDEEVYGVSRGEIIHRLDSKEIWKAYYVRNLVENLKNEDDSITMVKIYKEHFYQTVQSILFLQNVEKIDDSLLVEKKVYLPPNILSNLT
jgi:hypothetical protein